LSGTWQEGLPLEPLRPDLPYSSSFLNLAFIDPLYDPETAPSFHTLPYCSVQIRSIILSLFPPSFSEQAGRPASPWISRDHLGPWIVSRMQDPSPHSFRCAVNPDPRGRTPRCSCPTQLPKYRKTSLSVGSPAPHQA